jgi:sorbitol-specific phosphotransferase system component IIBC
MLSSSELISVCLKFDCKANRANDKPKEEISKSICEEKKNIIEKMNHIFTESSSMSGRVIRVVFSKNDEAFEKSISLSFR